MTREVKAETELLRVRELVREGDVMGALFVLDRLVDASRTDSLYLLRARLRERVGDFLGALADLDAVGAGERKPIAEARVLSELGYGDSAESLLRESREGRGKFSSPRRKLSALGIAGRRYDLELLGFSTGSTTDFRTTGVPTRFRVVDHLLALGEFAMCEGVLGPNARSRGSLMERARGIRRCDRLQSLEPDGDDVGKLINGIRGWLSADEARLLVSLAKLARGACVEIGSFCGRSTVSLCHGSKHGDGAKVYAVDPHDALQGITRGGTLQEIRDNLTAKGLSSLAEIQVCTSADAARSWRGPEIDLLFIDARHDYDSVKDDFERWIPLVAAGGYVAFHDVNQPGPNMLARDLVVNSSLVAPLGLRDSLFVFRKEDFPKLQTKEREIWTEYLATIGQNYEKWKAGRRRGEGREIRWLLKSLELQEQDPAGGSLQKTTLPR